MRPIDVSSAPAVPLRKTMNRNLRTQPRRLTLSRHPADVVRLCIYFVVLLCALVIQDGWLCQLIGATAIVLSLTLQVLRRPPFYRLAMVWELGFLLIVSVEGLTQAYDSVMQVGLDEYNWASRYLRQTTGSASGL